VRAPEFLEGRMNDFVLIQVGTGAESFVALVTLERRLSGMNQLVGLSVGGCLEGRVTECALKRPLVRVADDMLIQAVLHRERLIAHRARVRSLAGVTVQMDLESFPT